MKHILEFIEKHKHFIKKLILFILYIIINALFNNPSFVTFFNSLFQSDVAAASTNLVASGVTITALIGG